MSGQRPRAVVAAGTTESRRVAAGLLERGWAVLASQGTSVPMDWPDHPALSLRAGALGQDGWERLIAEHAPLCVVDAAHPFATILRRDLAGACLRTGVPCFRMERPPVAVPEWATQVEDAADLADRAFAPDRRILLTTGSKTLSVLHRAATGRGAHLWARLLPGPVSEAALEESGFPRGRVLWGRGRIPCAQWRALLADLRIDALATKESGEEGGLPEKAEACLAESADLYVVRRPPVAQGAFGSVDALLDAVEALRGTARSLP